MLLTRLGWHALGAAAVEHSTTRRRGGSGGGSGGSGVDSGSRATVCRRLSPPLWAAAAAMDDAPLASVPEPAPRPFGRGFIGEGNRPAAAYYSADFDHAEHLAACRPALEAQIAAALRLREERQNGQCAGSDDDGHADRAASSSSAAAAAAAVATAAAVSAAAPTGPSSGQDEAAPQPELSARARRRLRNAALRQQRRQQAKEQLASEKRQDEADAHASLLLEASVGSGEDREGGGGGGGGEDLSGVSGGGASAQGNAWEAFFRSHPEARFFRERRYLGLSFAALAPPSSAQQQPPLRHILELGAGNGCSVLPLLKLHPAARATACDISATSLRQLRAAAAADGIDARRVRAFVADATDRALAAALAADPADVALIMFTLSAVTPGADGGMAAMLANAAAGLRPGGRLCVRDHGVGDLVQLRIPPAQAVLLPPPSDGGDGGGDSSSSSGALVGVGDYRFGREQIYYARGDGTLAYFYTTEELAAMGRRAGLKPVDVRYARVTNRNRRRGQELRRVFVQAEFVKPC